LETGSGRPLMTLQHTAHVWTVAWHPNGRHLATGCGDSAIHIWDTTTGERFRKWGTGTYISARFNHQGNILASSGWDGYMRLWEFPRGRELVKTFASGGILRFSPDDRRLATAHWDGTGLDFFEVVSGQGLRVVHERQDGTSGAAGVAVFDPGGVLLAFP